MIRWLATPIPLASATDALGYGEIPVVCGPLWDEPLVAVGAYGVASVAWYARADGGNAPYGRALPGADPVVRARRSVAERLAAVNAALRPHGLALLVWDGWRSIACQQAIWDFFVAVGRARLPGAGEDELRAFAGRYASDASRFDPDDARTWPTHTTGGAVDVTLIDADGRALPMGTAFDEASPLTPSGKAEVGGEGGADPAWRANRRVLHGAMRDAGFVNYPGEWWHFDWGTQMAARFAPGHPAVYGPARG